MKNIYFVLLLIAGCISPNAPELSSYHGAKYQYLKSNDSLLGIRDITIIPKDGLFILHPDSGFYRAFSTDTIHAENGKAYTIWCPEGKPVKVFYDTLITEEHHFRVVMNTGYIPSQLGNIKEVIDGTR